MDLLQNFRNKEIIRGQIECSDQLNIWLDHCQYMIHIEFDKSSKQIYKYKKRKKQIDANFRNAFQNCNRQEKVQFYLRIVKHIQNMAKRVQQPPKISQINQKPIQGECECRSFNLKIWKLKNIRLDKSRHEIMVQNLKDNKIKTYDLRNYLLRKSKMKDKFTLVLQAINQKPHQKSRTVHIAFKDSEELKKWFQLIKQQVEVCQWLNVKSMLYGERSSHSSVIQKEDSNKKIQFNIRSSESSKKSQIQINSKTNKSEIKGQTSEQSISKQKNDKSELKQQNSSTQVDQQRLFKFQQQLTKQEQQLTGHRKTFIDHLVNDDVTDFQQFYQVMENETSKDIQQKKNLDFFHKLMPQYQLQELTELGAYQTIINEDGKFQILQSLNNSFRFKLIITFDSEKIQQKQLFCLISQTQNALLINDNIQEQNVKTLLKSQNSAIMYQTLKAYNKFYRLRDFIFVRHAFAHNQNSYLIDKSIDNINYPPFITFVRGEISAVWGIIKNEKQQKIRLIGDLIIVNSGLLNNQQQTNVSLRYLNGFRKLMEIMPNEKMESTLFDMSWNIDNKQVNVKIQEIRTRRKTIRVEKQKIRAKEFSEQKKQKLQFTKKSSSYYDAELSSPQKENVEHKEIEPDQRKQVHPQKVQVSQQLQIKQISPLLQIKETFKEVSQIQNSSILHVSQQIIRQLNQQGHVIIDNSYIKKRWIQLPIEKQTYKELPKIKGHAIWKGDWRHDQKVGGLIFINQKKIQEQKGVFKFVLTKIGKNILSGKSVLNISLPVDIFASQSNLERLMISLSYGPKLLQNLSNTSSIQKIANTIAFGISNSVLYINVDKPFNPILGQTFNCWINGCPGYAQQISHHPPIAALMFLGRGYKITCQLQSKVQLHMNSGCGINQGVYKVLFQNGPQICFTTPGNQVSGLTHGDRKFNLVGRSYCWIQKQRLFVEINYQAGKKGFFSKQQKPCDYFEGKLYQVRAQFFVVFPNSKKREPNQKQKVKQLGRFEGIWNKYIKFNDRQIFNFDKQIPIRIEYEEKPLGSDSNWREDIEYRRLNKTTKAQSEKQRLEQIQRGDRKLRAKPGKK